MGRHQAKAEALVWPVDRVLRYVPMAALRRETICGGELQHDEVEFNLA